MTGEEDARRAAIEALLGERLDALERIAGGGNNVVMRARASGRSWLVKAYDHHPGRDGRDRLEREHDFLTFLWREGVRCVPEPLAVDPARGLAVQAWVEGAPSTGPPGPDDVRALARFLGALWGLRGRPGADRLAPAAEATFTARGLVGLVEARLERLRAGLEDDAVAREARDFVEGDLGPTLDAVRGRVLAAVDPSAVLPADERTLSPSDVGFHNALRTAAGWVFVDFEYAGWDDPAKLLSDAVLHPAVPLPAPLTRGFVEDALGLMGDRPALVTRLRLLYPLWSIKWCLILLNEFLPGGRERRRRAAGGSAVDPRPGQLLKARVALGRWTHDPLG